MIPWMLHNAVVATILALLVWGTCHWKRLGPAARHALWMLVLIKLLMPPVVSWPWALTNPLAKTQAAVGALGTSKAPRTTPDATTTLVASASSPAPTAPVSAAASPASAPAELGQYWTMQRIVAALTALWLSGVAVYLLLQGMRIVRMARRTTRAKPAPALEELAAKLSRQIGLRPIRVREAAGLGSPFVWSLIRPVLLWPAEIRYDTLAGRAMLMHELAHVRRRDHWVGWLKLTAGSLWWWHPVYWHVCWKLSEEAELACDAWAVQKVAQARRAYAEALLAVCEKALRPAPVLAVGVMEGGRRIMERRLRMIMQEDVTLRLSRTGLAALGAIVLALAPAWAQTGSVQETGGRMSGSERMMPVREAAAPAPAPGLSRISPAPRLDDPGSWVPNVNGCLVEQTGSRIHIVGANNIDGWGHGNGITSTKALPEGDFYACVDFMVPQFKASATPAPLGDFAGRGSTGSAPGNALIYLRAHSSTGQMLALLYQPNAGTYQVQGWGSANAFSQPPLPKIGDEDRVFHRMKLKYSSTTRTAAGWVDDKFIGTLDYAMTGTVTFELFANTDKQGMQIDLLFDKFSVSSDISAAPPTPVTLPRAIRGGVGSVLGSGRGTGTSGAAGQIVKTEAASKTGSALHGGIGMGTWDTKAEFRDILVQTSDRKTLFQPYFVDGLDGWQKGGGEWVGGGGVLSQNSRAINCQITCGENSWTDYTYSLKARRTEGTEGFLIMFAAEDSKNLYWWNIGGWGDTRTAIEKMTRGGKREIPGTAVDLRIETGTWYDIAIAVHGDTADCSFDGKLITRITRDKGSSSMPDAGPPKVFNNGNGPEPARPAGRSGAGRATD